MTASPILPAGDPGLQRTSLPEWFRLRRHPMPEYYTSLQRLPPDLLALAEPALSTGQAVRGALVLPGEYYARKGFSWEYVPPRALVFLDDRVLYVAGETLDDSPNPMLLDAKELLYLRSSLLLLYGLLEFKADCGSRAGEIRIEYNTVIWQALGGSIARFVDAAGSRPALLNEEQGRVANARILASLPFKFANGLRYYALAQGELLCAAIFQPAIWQGRRILPQQITPNTLFALTDRKLVLIEETRSSGWRRRTSQGEYGWIFTYIPRDRVIDMVFAKGTHWTELTVSLEWGSATDERVFLLEPLIAAQWEQAWLRGRQD